MAHHALPALLKPEDDESDEGRFIDELAALPFVLEQSPLDQLLPYVGLEGGKGLDQVLSSIPDEQAQRAQIMQYARSLLTTDTNALMQLEQWLTMLLNNDERTDSGIQKLQFAYHRFDGIRFAEFRHRLVIDHVLESANLWEKSRPDSIFAPVFKARMLRNIALTARSIPAAIAAKDNEIVNPDKYLELAHKTLEASRETASRNPEWYVEQIQIRHSQKASVGEVMRIVDEGTRRFPQYSEIGASAAIAMFALSDNVARDYEAIAVVASERAESGGSDSAYARMYISAFFGAGLKDFNQLRMNTVRFAAGAEEIVKRYPVQWNYQRLAKMACAIKDKNLAQRMFTEIKGRPIVDVWGQFEFQEACRVWAHNKDDFERPDLQTPEIEN